MAQNITIYTSTTCASCGMVKKYLGMKGASYEEVNIDEQPERQAEVRAMTGESIVPVTVVTKDDGSQSIARGYNLSQLSAALN